MAETVVLGGITVTPGPRGQINYSNPRAIAKIDIPGAAPTYQDMGADETIISWTGVFIDDNAYARAVEIENMKNAGQPVALQVGIYAEISKNVRIRKFDWDLLRQNRVNYSIELVVDTVSPTPSKVLQQAPAQSGSSGTTVQTQPQGKTYTVKQGDTLWALAQKNLGNGTRWREIASANKILDPSKLQVGQKIVISG
ncbi:mannose-binding lectin precursor [Desulfocucumis palustris]|uniref:Mannose-binding lectin n=1 Tax=Desulfocucumis palustris TaxID=1898651 RepID=A0A2L2XD22_9FIRM|nr:LysM domain-containing protein [Desulfocucumis palustris]GBF34148.1 mannose-binding lectin precursor [Desulfocucumis palustris]